MKAITPETTKAIHRNLTDFGYPGLTIEFVQAQVDGIIAGERPKNVIGMFAKEMLLKNGYLEE